MKKQKIIALFTAVVCLVGCSAPSENVTVDLSQSSYSAFEALDQGDWEKAIGLFQSELEKEDTDFVSMMGLAKAQIGMEDYDSAKETLLEIQRQYPDECQPFSYQGLVYEKLEDYESAATAYYEWSRSLIAKETDADTGNEQSTLGDYSDLRLAKERFSENLRKIEDIQIRYNLAKGLYLLQPDDYSLLPDYMRSCANLGDSVCGDELLDAVKGTDAEYIVTAIVKAYRLVKSGDIDAAKELLFDPEYVDDYLPGIQLDYGDVVNGKLEGVRVSVQMVFGRWGVVIGSAANDMWDGECEAWNATRKITTNESNEIEEKRYTEEIYIGTWKEGYPEGAFLKKESEKYLFPEDPEEDFENRSETEIQFVDGLAEGESVEYRLWEENGIWSIDKGFGITIHQFKEGKAVPFMANTDAGELMVYEWDTNFDRKKTWFYKTDDCGHSYIWETQ